MPNHPGPAKTAAILMADVAGYSALSEEDEAGAVSLVRSLLKEVIAPAAARHGGRVVKTMGDGFLLEFAAPAGALGAAQDIRRGSSTAGGEGSFQLRIGIHTGDVIADGEDLFGNSINITARIEAMANPGEICLSEQAYRAVKGRPGLRFDDLGPQIMHNIRTPVRIFRLADRKDGAAAGPGESEISLAVLPFASSAPEETVPGYFADGLTEDIISGLCRFRELRVVAPGSCFRFRGMRVPSTEAADTLGVRYIVEGSLRQAGGRLRVTVNLAEGRSGLSLWSDHYDRETQDLFEVQDDIVMNVVQTLAGRLKAIGRNRAVSRVATGSILNAYDLLLKARAIILDSRDALQRCRRYYEMALEADPDCAPAYAGLAGTYSFEWTSGWSDSREATQDRALALLLQSLRLDDMDSETHRRLGVLYIFRGEHGPAKMHLDRALQLNPNDAHAMAYQGLYRIYQGEAEKALRELDRATRHNPFHPTFYLWFIGLAHYLARDYESAIAPLHSAAGLYPGFVVTHRHLAAAYARLGNRAEAARECSKVLELEPDFSVSGIGRTLPYCHASDKEHYLDGLRLAGLPD